MRKLKAADFGRYVPLVTVFLATLWAIYEIANFGPRDCYSATLCIRTSALGQVIAYAIGAFLGGLIPSAIGSVLGVAIFAVAAEFISERWNPRPRRVKPNYVPMTLGDDVERHEP